MSKSLEDNKTGLELIENASTVEDLYVLAKHLLANPAIIKKTVEQIKEVGKNRSSHYDNYNYDYTYYRKNIEAGTMTDILYTDLLLRHAQIENTYINADFIISSSNSGREKDQKPSSDFGMHTRNIRIYELLAQLGLPSYQLDYAMWLLDKTQTEDDLPVIYLWLKKSADQGNAVAQYLVGIFLLTGTGVVKNVEVSLVWLVKAANGHMRDAIYTILALQDKGYYFQDFPDDQSIELLEKLTDWQLTKPMGFNLATGNSIAAAFGNDLGNELHPAAQKINQVVQYLVEEIAPYEITEGQYIPIWEMLAFLYERNGNLQKTLDCITQQFYADLPGINAGHRISQMINLKISLGQPIDQAYIAIIDDALSGQSVEVDGCDWHNSVAFKILESQVQLWEKNEELIKINKKLQKKEQELEEMMAMFAHKFRSPLDAILYNTTHGNISEIYERHAHTMRGLLDIFSIMSTDQNVLISKLSKDNSGEGNLEKLLVKAVDMILLHLLTEAGSDKIHQHFLAYAKKTNIVPVATSAIDWYEEYFELENSLRSDWQQEYAEIVEASNSLNERLRWIDRYFFNLKISGFDNSIRFKEYGTTESFLVIIINEILTNLFKYYFSDTGEGALLTWQSIDGWQTIECRNPSVKSERVNDKGSYKGHKFLSAIAKKTSSKFEKPIMQDDFGLVFAIPNNILIK